MPKLVDYGVRFEFLREAAFATVRDQGVAALSRRSLAAALGTSVNTVRRLLDRNASLVGLAADEVAARRRHGRLGRLREAEPTAAATHLLRKLLPDEARRIAEELVWFRLLLATHRHGVQDHRPGTGLRERYRAVEHGYDTQADEQLGDDRIGDTDVTDPAWEHHRATHDRHVTGLVDDALRMLSVTAQHLSAERLRTRALVEGLALQVCVGNATPEESVACLERHLRRLHDGLG